MFIVYLALSQIFLFLILQGTYELLFVYILCMYLCFKRYGRLYLGSLFILTIILLLLSYVSFDPLDTHLKGKVTQVKEYHYILNTKEGKVKVNGDTSQIEVGHTIHVEVEYIPFKPMTNFNGFDTPRFYYSQHVFYQANEIKRVEHIQQTSLLGRVEKWIDRWPNKNTASFTKQLLLGIKDDQIKEVLEMGSTLSILHLFALSGMHMSILKSFLVKIGIKHEALLLILLGSYVFFLGNIVSLWRAYLMLLGRYLFKDKFNDLQLLSIISLLFCLYNPYIIYSLSFIYSFILYAFLIISKKTKHEMIYPFLASIPLIIYFQHSIQPLSLFYVWLFSGVIGGMYILVFINFLTLNIVSIFVNSIVFMFEQVIRFLHTFSFEIIIMRPPALFMIGYYGVLLFILYREHQQRRVLRYLLHLAGLILILISYPYIQPFSKVVMIDVGQGDSFLIIEPFNKGNYMIDTGGNLNVDLATNTIIPYLKSLGINHLDALIITHDDYDHSGASESLIKHFKVNQVITKAQDIGPFQSLPLNIDSIDPNDNSLVYYLNLNDMGYLFTGDLPSEYERQIIEKYPNLKVDVLKIGHHGSNTSTSSMLLQHFKPKYGLISVKEKNIYRHPHPDVIKRLESYGVRVYRSDLHGMVEMMSFGVYRRIDYCRNKG